MVNIRPTLNNGGPFKINVIQIIHLFLHIPNLDSRHLSLSTRSRVYKVNYGL